MATEQVPATQSGSRLWPIEPVMLIEGKDILVAGYVMLTVGLFSFESGVGAAEASHAVRNRKRASNSGMFRPSRTLMTALERESGRERAYLSRYQNNLGTAQNSSLDIEVGVYEYKPWPSEIKRECSE